MKANPLAIIVGTCLYTGYIPLGPGTIASIVALPIVFLLCKNWSIYILITIISLSIGTLAAQYLGKIWKRKDDQRITIDEFIGILVTFLLIPKINWYWLIVGFILFRFFDIVKPLFIRQAEKVKGGLGVMLDDLVAGIYANICLRIILLII